MSNLRKAVDFAAGVLALGLVLAAPVAGAAQARTIGLLEQAFESSSAEISIPDAVGRSITLPGCSKVCPSSVPITAQSRFFIGSREVTLAQLRARLASGNVGLTLFYDAKSFELTRIIAN